MGLVADVKFTHFNCKCFTCFHVFCNIFTIVFLFFLYIIRLLLHHFYFTNVYFTWDFHVISFSTPLPPPPPQHDSLFFYILIAHLKDMWFYFWHFIYLFILHNVTFLFLSSHVQFQGITCWNVIRWNVLWYFCKGNWNQLHCVTAFDII